MYEQLSELLTQAYYYYGPVTREQAFDVPVQSWATSVGKDWYVGTNEPVEALAHTAIERPAHLNQPIDATIEENTEQPSA